MKKIIISDAGPLIALAKINRLDLLNQLFEQVWIPKAVLEELEINSGKKGALVLKNIIENKKWIKIKEVLDIPLNLKKVLDLGELQAIILAKKEKIPLLIDEKIGRKFAKKEGVKIVGTAALFVVAKQKGIIKKVNPILDEIRNSGYRLSDGICNKILELAGE